MFRALSALLVMALAAAAEDWTATCRALASDSSAEREAAIEALRNAGPEAAPAIDEAAGGDSKSAALAKAVRSARKWDPERRIADLDLLAELEAAGADDRLEALNRLAALGSAVAGPAMGRVLEAARADDRAATLLSISGAPGRDPGWARESCRWLADPVEQVHLAAIVAASRHAGHEQVGDLRVALARENSPAARQDLRRAIVWLADSVDDLPPFPESSEEYMDQLASMASSPSGALRLAAWHALERRRPVAIPSAPGFWEDPARLLSILGTDEFDRQFLGPRWLRRPPVGVRRRMAQSPLEGARRTATVIEELIPIEVVLVTSLLRDPDLSVRADALHALERWDWQRRNDPEPDRRQSWIRFGAAARFFLDLAAGAGDPLECLPATRVLVSASRASGIAASVAYQCLRLAPGPGREALAVLEADKDLGTAAKRLRQLLQHDIGTGGVGFGRGLDDPPRLRWQQGGTVDVEVWKALCHSENAEEKRLAADLAGGAWDRLDGREGVGPELRLLAADNDPQMSMLATRLLAAAAPELLPEREALDLRDGWARPRAAVLARLRATSDAAAVVDRLRLPLLQGLGDRSIILSALYAGRFDNPATESWLISRGDPAFVPVLVERAASLTAIFSAPWFSALASCSPEGARWTAAFALDSAPAPRAAALTALLMRPWGDAWSEEAFLRGCGNGDKISRQAVISAVRSTALRSRPALPVRMADALAGLLLDLESDASAAPELEVIVPVLGEALGNTSPEWRAKLGANRRIAALAANAGIDLGDTKISFDRVLLGDPGARQTALVKLPPERLVTIRLIARTWLMQGRGGDISEAWLLNRSQERAAIALLAWALDDPDSRQSLLDLRSQLRRWVSAASSMPGSFRVAEAEAPAEFFGNSEAARQRAVGALATTRSPAVFSSLCAAAFRGGMGDEIALSRVAPFLGPETLPRIAPLLGSRFAGVRALAAQIAGRLGAAAPRFAVAALRASLPGDDNAASKAAKLAALARLGDAEGLAGIRALAASGGPDDRLAATRALAMTPTREAAALLARLANDDDFPVRDAADTALRVQTSREYPADVSPWEARDWEGWLAAHPNVVLKDPIHP